MKCEYFAQKLYLCSMEIQLLISEMKVLRKRQRNLTESSDYARYYHNRKLKEWVNGTKIKQIFLPVYSPNLNLLERHWKILRKKVTNTELYCLETFCLSMQCIKMRS